MALDGLSIAQQQLTISVGVALILASAVVVLSKARLSDGVRNPGPLWSHFAFQIPIYVCSTLIAVAFFDVRQLWIFDHVSDADFYDASLWLIYGVVAYCLFFLVFDRLFVERTRRYRKKEDSRCLCIAISLIQLVVLLSIGFFAHGLPIFGVLTGKDLGILRHDATTDFQGPVYLLAAARTLSTMGMAYFGVLRGSGKRHVPLYVLLGISAFGLVWDAEKSPLAQGILILYFAKAWASKKPLKTRTFVKIAVVAGVVLVAMFFAAMRNATVSEVLTYLSVRLFLGQSSGYYQAYATVQPNLKYVLSWVPFAGLFSHHVPSFNRDLMVTLHGVTATNGLLNSIFLAEAYGVFGTAGLLVSPLIVAFAVIIGLRIFRRAFSGLVGEYFGAASLFVLMDGSNLTGGFAGFPFLRNAIVPFGILMLVVGVYALVLGPARRRTVTGHPLRRAGGWSPPEACNQTMLSRVPAGGEMRT